MNYDTVPGKNQLYSTGTDKADSWCRMELLDDDPRALQFYHFEVGCLVCLGLLHFY